MKGAGMDRMTIWNASAGRRPRGLWLGAVAGKRRAAVLFVVSMLALSMNVDAARAQGLNYREAGKAPPHWSQFAKLVRFRFEDWIGADDAVADRLRSYLRESAGKADGPPPTLDVRVWLNPDGTIERVAFASLKGAQADEDLRTVLTRGNVGEAPPPEMLQPLNLRFSLNQVMLKRPEGAAGRPPAQ
jgi:hypothetical protein